MEKSVLGTFNNTEYQITVAVENQILTLTLISTESGVKWSRSFTQKEIETLTHRAKNAKSFSIFCKMLYGSLENTS
jgi:mannitol-1-phosphate/altronate dehydrogenase